MTNQELAGHDGRDGRPAYIAVNGTIYDVTASPLWSGGDHQGSHQAGRELGEELKNAPHVRSVIERFPVVGRIEDAAAPAKTANAAKMVGIVILIVAALLAFLLSR
jgi:predicted heme/steroid binding protein